MSRDSNSRLAYSTESTGDSRADRRRAKKGVAPATSGGSGIRLRLDRRTSDRIVTTITGLPGNTVQIAETARQLRSACGTGGTFKNGVVELQGDHRERVERFFEERGLKWKRAGG